MVHDPSSVLTRPAPPPDLTLRYGDHPDHVIDVRLPPPDQPRRPLVVFIHGGFWRTSFDRAHTGPLATDLAARGWPVAAIEFRRVGQEGGGWPGTLDDVAAAINALPRLLDEAGVPAASTPPIFVGHSAGGQLALWAASASERSSEASDAVGFAAAEVKPRGVLALAGVCDLRHAYDLQLGGNAVGNLLGGGPDEYPDRYARADPMAWGRLDVPVTLVHGTDDPHVPLELSTRYAAATGAPLVELPGVEHFGVIDPQSDAWPAVVKALSEI